MIRSRSRAFVCQLFLVAHIAEEKLTRPGDEEVTVVPGEAREVGHVGEVGDETGIHAGFLQEPPVFLEPSIHETSCTVKAQHFSGDAAGNHFKFARAKEPLGGNPSVVGCAGLVPFLGENRFGRCL